MQMMKKNSKKITLLLLLMMLINFGGQNVAMANAGQPLATTSSNIKFTVNADQTTYVSDGGYWDINVTVTNSSQNYNNHETKLVQKMIDGVPQFETDASGNQVPIMIEQETGNKSEQNNAYSVTAKASIANPDKVYIDGSGIIFSNRGIDVGRSDSGKIRLKTSADAESATVPITISIDYYDIANKLQTTTETIYVRLDAPKKVDPIIEIKQLETLPLGYVDAGMEFTMGFEVYNPGDVPAKNIKLTMDGLAIDNSVQGVNMASGLGTKDITELKPKSSEYIFFDLKTAKTNPGGTHPLTLKYKFVGEDKTKAPLEGTYAFSVDIKKLDVKPSTVVFEKISFPTGAIGRNKSTSISFTIKNNGKSDAKNLNISALSQDQTGLVPKSASSVTVAKLGPGQSATYNFDFQSTNAAETKSYEVKLKVDYADDSTTADKPHSIEQSVGVFVTAPKEVGADGKPVATSTPKLIIENYSFSPDIIEAGQTFTMYLTLYNTNAKKTVKNIKLFLTSEPSQSANTEAQTASQSTSVFTPVESSNTFFIDSIAPGGRIDKEIKLSTVPDTLAKTYTITANFEYEDTKAEKYTATELIGVPVIQKARFEVGELQVAPEIYMGQPNDVLIDFYNTGKVTLNNVMVKISGEGFTSDSPSYYKGNFNPGTQDTFSVGITPNQEGEIKGSITFSYEDSTGEKQEIVEEFTTTATGQMDPYAGMSPEEIEMMMSGEEGAPKGGLLTNPLLWIGVVAVAGIVGFIVYKKKKKQREEEELNIDED